MRIHAESNTSVSGFDHEADFDEIAEAQGWSGFTILTILRDYICVADSDGGERLAEFARGVADEENGVVVHAESGADPTNGRSTPEQIAAQIATRPARELENTDLQELLLEAIWADRAQRRRSVNPIIDSVLTDAPLIGLAQAIREHLGEIAGHFDNDPVADFGQSVVDEAQSILERMLDLVPAAPSTSTSSEQGLIDRALLVYQDENGKEYTQPVRDIMQSGTLLDPASDDDLDLVALRIDERDRTGGGP